MAHQHIYGFSLFDELHNFMPELLYDDELFPNLPFQWMRSRVRSLFPRDYTREHQHYRLYAAAYRRAAFEQWRTTVPSDPSVQTTPVTTNVLYTPTVPPVPSDPHTSTISVHISDPLRMGATVATAATAATAATTAVVTPQRSTTAVLATPPPRRVHTVFNTRSMNFNDILEPTLTNNRWIHALIGALEQPANMVFEDIPVAPSNEQIDEASDLVEAIDIPNDTICSVCQHHDYRANDRSEVVRQPSWRRLRCDHEFHRPCVDRWFTQSVYCPVCRYDIRT